MVEQRNIYKGHRYVPKIMGEWNKAESYEGLSIVTNQGDSYTSKKRVPAGVELSNEEYWVVTGNYNAQIEEYREDVKEQENNLQNYKTETDKKLNKTAINVSLFGAIGDGIADDTIPIQNAIDSLPDGGGTILIPANMICKYSVITINRNDVKLTGGGTLLDGYFNIGGTTAQTIKTRIDFDNINFKFTTLKTGNNPIRLQWIVRLKIHGCNFFNADKTIEFLGIDYPQQTSRVQIYDNYFFNVNYAVYSKRPVGGVQPLIIADIHFIHNTVENCQITHVHLEGVDGLVMTENTLFFPSYMQKTTAKKYNVYIDYCDWTMIYGNNLFEAGLESVLIRHGQHVNIYGNEIAWCGQKEPSSAIRFADGDNANVTGNFNISNVSNNVIMFPTRNGIQIDSGCGHININGNNIFSAGTDTYYYGSTPLTGIEKFGIFTAISTSKINVIGNQMGLNDLGINGETNYFSDNMTGSHNGAKKSNIKIISTGLTSLDATNVDTFVLNQSPASTITTISGFYEGKELTLNAFSAYTTISSTAVSLKEGVNLLIPSGKSLFIKYVNGKWREMGRDF